jgi:hypothetical protein
MMWLLSMDGRVTSDVIREFNAQSPRTVAIVGAAILEDCLERLLKLRFPVDGDERPAIAPFCATRAGDARPLFHADEGPDFI